MHVQNSGVEVQPGPRFVATEAEVNQTYLTQVTLEQLAGEDVSKEQLKAMLRAYKPCVDWERAQLFVSYSPVCHHA